MTMVSRKHATVSHAKILCSFIVVYSFLSVKISAGLSFCGRRSVMLYRPANIVDALCSSALAAGGRTAATPRRISAELNVIIKR